MPRYINSKCREILSIKENALDRELIRQEKVGLERLRSVPINHDGTIPVFPSPTRPFPANDFAGLFKKRTES